MVKDQDVNQVYALRGLILTAGQQLDRYNACNNPGVMSSYDVAMLALRDMLLQRYPLDTYPNQATVVDQVPITAPVLSVLGVSLGSGVKLSVTNSSVVGIRLL